MIIKFFGSVQRYTGGESFCDVSGETVNSASGEVVCNASAETTSDETHGTLQDVLAELGKKYGNTFSDFICADNSCLILLNSKGIAHTGGLASTVKQGDIIEILPFIDAG